jgi:hypothetical protein
VPTPPEKSQHARSEPPPRPRKANTSSDTSAPAWWDAPAVQATGVSVLSDDGAARIRLGEIFGAAERQARAEGFRAVVNVFHLPSLP